LFGWHTSEGVAMLDLALIPARGGSVGLPGKNIRPLGGVPLIGWTIRAAIASDVFARVVVSTDDRAIAEAARYWGAEVPFMRPEELAGPAATSDSVIAHALASLDVTGSFALLQPTSPFRSAEHLRNAAQLFASADQPGLVSVGRGKPLAWLRRVNHRGHLTTLIETAESPSRRQDAESIVHPNGAIYMVSARTFRERAGMPRDGQLAYRMGLIDSLDIDEFEDFEFAEAVVASGLREID
jgi:CMP-N-acetylneuraminic acid synthetase